MANRNDCTVTSRPTVCRQRLPGARQMAPRNDKLGASRSPRRVASPRASAPTIWLTQIGGLAGVQCAPSTRNRHYAERVGEGGGVSIEAMAIALHHSRARGTAKLVLIGIANHDGDGGAWPSVATLAKYAAVTPRNVQKALRELEALGEIRTHLQAGGNGRGPAYERPNLYDFTLACPDGCDRTTKHLVTPPVASDTPGVSNPTGGGVSEATPKPSSQPPNESSDWSEDSGLRAAAPGLRPPPVREKMSRRRLDDIGQKDPMSVFWTLYREHGADRPSAFLAKLVDDRRWDGFVGRHGISEYQSSGEAA